MNKKIVLIVIILCLLSISCTLGFFLLPTLGKQIISEDAKFTCGSYYARGGNNVYWVPHIGECLNIPFEYEKVTSDADSFKILINDLNIAKDSEYIISSVKIGEVKDITTFEIIEVLKTSDGVIQFAYGRDSKSIYYLWSSGVTPLEGVNPETWSYLDCGISHDGERIYDSNNIITTVDEINPFDCDPYEETIEDVLTKLDESDEST